MFTHSISSICLTDDTWLAPPSAAFLGLDREQQGVRAFRWLDLPGQVDRRPRLTHHQATERTAER